MTSLLGQAFPGPAVTPKELPAPLWKGPGPRDTHILPHVILGAHQVLHVCPQLLVLPLKLLLGLQGLLEGPGQRQGFGFFLSGFCFSSVSLFCIARRNVLLFC